MSDQGWGPPAGEASPGTPPGAPGVPAGGRFPYEQEPPRRPFGSPGWQRGGLGGPGGVGPGARPPRRRAGGARWRDPQVIIAIGLILIALYALGHHLSTTTLLLFAVAVPSIILHEVAHGAVALAFGDDTAKRAGRLTLNPLKHIDPIGTILLPALLALAGLGAFGYAKPVPVNPARMRSPRNASLVVSLAGPATNLAIAAASLVAFRALNPVTLNLGEQALYLLGLVNVILAVFNALPIPPLDGSALVERVLPRSAWPTWLTIRRFALPVVLLLVLVDPGQFLVHIFDAAERAWNDMLTA